MAVKEQEVPKTGLVLDSLEVKNFRAFKHLTIEKLGRVNLITGKNNVGKTSLLEAIWVYLSDASPRVMYELLERRDEIGDRLRFSSPIGFAAPASGAKRELSPYASTNEPGWGPYLASFFNMRRTVFEMAKPFVIQTGSSDRSTLIFDLTFVDPATNKPLDDPESNKNALDGEPAVRIDARGHKWQRSLGDYEKSAFLWMGVNDHVTGYYIPSTGIGGLTLASLWDRVALTESEDSVTSILRQIDSRIQRISFLGLGSNSRMTVPFVKLSDFPDPVPLRRLGDGVNRLLGILLALAGSQGGVLLIDEIENGLHHSVLLHIWQSLLEMADRLNVQIFATTHSWECVEAFQEAADENDDPDSGVLVRLQSRDGNVTSTVFDERRLAIVARDGIEVR